MLLTRRFTASLLPAILQYYERSGSEVKSEHFSESFYKPFHLYESNMVDHIIRGLTKSHAQAEDIHVIGDMTNKMFMNSTTGMGLDLVILSARRFASSCPSNSSFLFLIRSLKSFNKAVITDCPVTSSGEAFATCPTSVASTSSVMS